MLMNVFDKLARHLIEKVRKADLLIADCDESVINF